MHVIGTSEGVQRAFARSAAGLMPYEDDFSMWNAIPTGADPSQAPDGQDNFYGYVATAPLELEGGWTGEARQGAGQAVVNKLAKFYDGVEELELGRQVATNRDFTDRANMTAGNLTHVDMILSRAGPLRPARGLAGYITPIESLYLSGAGSHPGGGITGGPGYMTAREYLRNRKKRPQLPALLDAQSGRGGQTAPPEPAAGRPQSAHEPAPAGTA
jgi:phytoene dehydrogenase-like protein